MTSDAGRGWQGGMGGSWLGTPSWISIPGPARLSFEFKEPCFNPHPGGFGPSSRITQRVHIMSLEALLFQVLCVIALFAMSMCIVEHTRNKKPMPGRTRTQATRNTPTQTTK